MRLFYIFVFLWPWPLFGDNWNISNSDPFFLITSESNRLNRYPKAIGSKKQKPMDCKKLYATQSTPWIAVILNKESGRLICLGSIIDERHILTAFRCIENRDVSTFKILLGYYKAYWGSQSQVIMIEEAFKHEHELVILKLKKAIVFSKRIKPVKLLAYGKSPPSVGSSSQKDSSVPGVQSKSALHLKKNETRVFGESKSIDKNFDDLEDKFKNRSDDLIETKKEKQKRVKKGNPPLTKNPMNHLLGGNKNFFEKYAINEVIIAGFPVTSTDGSGDLISKHLVYTLRDDEISDKDPYKTCKSFLRFPFSDEKEQDANLKTRFYCVKGESKFCWGCLGGPILNKKNMQQIGVIGGVSEADNCHTSAKMLYGLRVDIYIKWIRQHSFYL